MPELGPRVGDAPQAPEALTPVRPASDPAAEIKRARALAAGLAPRSVQVLGELVEDEDGRVALAACESLRRWVEQSAPGGAGNKENGMMAESRTEHDAKCEEAQAIRFAVEAAMRGSSRAEVWAAIAARLHERGLKPVHALTTDELLEGVGPNANGTQ